MGEGRSRRRARPSLRSAAGAALAIACCVAIASGCGGDGASQQTSTARVPTSGVLAPPMTTTTPSSPVRQTQRSRGQRQSRERRPPGVSLSTLARDLAVFRGARIGEDEMPAELASKVEAALPIDVATSRLARGFEGKPAYLVPGPAITCLFTDNDAVGSCWGTPAVSGGFATTTALCGPGLPRGRVATFGIAHDWVERVTVLRSHVPDRTVPVAGNVYVAMTSSKPPLPARLALEGEGKRSVQRTGLPPRIVKEGCDAPLGKPG